MQAARWSESGYARNPITGLPDPTRSLHTMIGNPNDIIDPMLSSNERTVMASLHVLLQHAKPAIDKIDCAASAPTAKYADELDSTENAKHLRQDGDMRHWSASRYCIGSRSIHDACALCLYIALFVRILFSTCFFRSVGGPCASHLPSCRWALPYTHPGIVIGGTCSGC